MLLNCYGFFFSWLAPNKKLNQSALQWWHQRQCDRQHHSAELIRDGLLQNLFALRRSLELTHAQQQPVSAEQLHQLESLYGELETISNHLSPAFSRDNVTLAMQHILNRWQSEHPTVTLSSHLTANASPEHPMGDPPMSEQSMSEHHISLMLLEDCLGTMEGVLSETAAVDITFANSNPYAPSNNSPDSSSNNPPNNFPLKILTQPPNDQHSTATLMLHIQEANDHHRRAIATHFVYLCRSFTLLTGGTSTHTKGKDWLQWKFCWPLRSPPSS